MSTLHETHSATAHAADTGERTGAPGQRSVRPRPTWTQRFTNNWPVVPLRLFLGALFLFAAYAKFSYPGFFGSSSPVGLKHLIDAARPGSPIDGALKPVSNNASLFGHIAAGAEIAIGAGLVLGFFARIAALGGIAYTTIIALSIHWNSIRQYTGSEGWFTSVDIAIAVALTTFLLGGAGPLSVDRLFSYLRARRDAADDAEPSFYDSDTAESRRRLSPQEEYPAATDYPTTAIGYPVNPPTYPPAAPHYPEQLPASADPVPAVHGWSDPHTEQFATASDATQQFAAPSVSAPPTDAQTVPAQSVPATATRAQPDAEPADFDHVETAELEPDPRGAIPPAIAPATTTAPAEQQPSPERAAEHPSR